MNGTIVQILGVIAPFLTAILVLLIIFGAKVLRERSKNQIIMKAIENGVELSPDLFKHETSNNESVKRKKEDPLTSALVTIGAGIGIFIALYTFFNQPKFAAFGFIPLFVGLGQLIGYLVNKKQNRNSNGQNNIDE